MDVKHSPCSPLDSGELWSQAGYARMATAYFHGSCGIHLNSMALEQLKVGKGRSALEISISCPPREREFGCQVRRRTAKRIYVLETMEA